MSGICQSMFEKWVPIHKNEMTKFLWLSVMIILVVYVHTVLKISKDALVISRLGTETISAIKLYIVTPLATVFVLTYIKMAGKFNRSSLFYILTWFFIGYFVLFALVLYPHKELYTLDLSGYAAQAPALKYLFRALGDWPCSIYYLFSEMWVSMMLSISFWQIANHLVTIPESKRFYPLLGLVAQVGMLIASIAAKSFITQGSDWQPTLNKMVASVVFVGVLITISFVGLSKNVGIDVMNGQGKSSSPKKGKYKIGLTESLKLIVASKPILLITALLLCYNVGINLLEGVWKKSIEVYATSNANEVQNIMSTVNIWVAVLSLIAAGGGIVMLRRFKWCVTAMMTPIFILITGVLFFALVVFGSFSAALATSLFAAVLWGAVNNVFARATKHTVFDATKEMAYIPLDDELKTKGKAAAEMIGMRFGKGSGAFLQQGLLAIFTGMSLIDLAPGIFAIFGVVMLCWIIAVFALNKKLSGKLDTHHTSAA